MDASRNPRPGGQLDLFADSQEVVLRNELADALARRDALAARRALAALAAASPTDALLDPAQRLLQAVVGHEVAGPPDDPVRRAAARQHLRALEPAAAAVLGEADGRVWLQPLWRGLAQRHADRPWNPAQPDDHAAPLWLALGDCAQAEQAVARIPSWRRIPQPLAWMTEARCRQGGVDEAWPLLAELAWLAPRRLAALLDTLADPLLLRLRRRFEADFDPDPSAVQADDALAWFPAWVLTHTPALAPRLAAAEPGQGREPERGMRCMVELLGLERQGRHHDLMARRKALRDLSAPLYAAYMATR